MLEALFPDAATTIRPAARMLYNAFEKASELVLNPQLALTRLAPLVRAYSKQVMQAEILPARSLSKHLQAMICTRQATPATPTPLLPTAPRIPATIVPWPLSSLGSVVPASAFKPWLWSVGFTHILAARSS